MAVVGDIFSARDLRSFPEDPSRCSRGVCNVRPRAKQTGKI